MEKKSQSSFEFMVIFGIGFSLIIILGGVFFSYSNSAQKGLDKKQIDNIADELMSNIERIYFLGKGNRITMKTTFPDGIENFTIVHKNISGVEFDYLNISTYNEKLLLSNIYETNEYVRFNCTACYHSPLINGEGISSFNQSDFSVGQKNIRIESFGDYVSVDFYKG